MKQAFDFKKEYDKVVLIAVALLAVVSAFFLRSASQEGKEKSRLASARTSGTAFSGDPLVASLQDDLKSLQQRKNWRESEASPFVSRVYLLREGRLVDIREPGNDLYSGIPNAWLVENAFEGELVDDLPERDADNDGFTNREEYEGKTNPRDPASSPAPWTKFRLGDVKVEKLQIIFKGRELNGSANINSVAASAENLQGEPIGPTRTYAVGETLQVVKFRPGFNVTYDTEDIPFRLKGFRTEKRPTPGVFNPDGTPQIESVDSAILESTSGDGTTIELEVDQAETSPYSLATILDSRHPEDAGQQVRVGQSFRLGQSENYKLIDVSEEKAMIKALSSGEEHLIPKAATPEAPPSLNQTP